MKSLLSHINFAECPSWVFSLADCKKKVLEMENDLKFSVSSESDIPNAEDVLLFYYLLSLAFDPASGKYGYSVVAEHGSIAMHLYGPSNSHTNYKTVASLRQWSRLESEFCVIGSKTIPLTFLVFNFIDCFWFSEYEETIFVEFGHKYIDLLNNSQNVSPLPFNGIKKLNSVKSKYLYRLLLELLLDKKKIRIPMDSLQKSGIFFAETPAEILEILIPAVTEINRNTNLSVHLETRPEKNGKPTFVFEKI